MSPEPRAPAFSLAEGFASADPATRKAACNAVLEDPQGALFLERLCDLLADSEQGVARCASRTLLSAHRRGEGVPALLRGVLRHGASEDGRLHAALTLSQISTPGPELLPALVEGLEHPTGSLRWESARALVDVGRLYPETVTLLVGFVGHGEGALLRRMTIYCLCELAPDLPEATEALLSASRAPEAAIARAACTAMAGLLSQGLSPPVGVPERFRELATGDDPTLRVLAERALRQSRAQQPG